MLRIARELSDADACSFSIFEDVTCETDEKPSHRRHIEVQTEISCDHVEISTDVSIRSEVKSSFGSPDLVFWRAVATQRARELDEIRENIRKIEELTLQNIDEMRAIDKKHDELYAQIKDILESQEDGGEDEVTSTES
ncbi:hypothetical protein Q1695_014813 [Nippostrongylus brasiliensis]|nr:hypothetical protein Q1695_014813 [Nippostrongylus brasiliensis]